MNQLKYLFLCIFTVCGLNLLFAQVNLDSDKSMLASQITEFSKGLSSLNDTITNIFLIKYNSKRNIVSIVGRVKKAPDPFYEKLGNAYKEYYRRTQIVNIINNFDPHNHQLWNLLYKCKPDFSFIFYGKSLSLFDINFNEIYYAKERISKGYKYIETYNDFLVEAYFCSLEKEELVSLIWKQIQLLAKKTPYATTEHIVVSKINMSSDNTITYEYIQDDITSVDKDLSNERLMQFFEFQSWKRGFLKALSYNNIKFRYKYINKSNKQVCIDITFSGEELLEIYDSINREKSYYE